jgi:S-adenosylmethionine:tRNA ribosyltransferase-isomerase
LDFTLPPELEASEPPEARGLRRDEVRLLVSYRESDRLVDTTFLHLAWFLDPGDIVVVNDSETIPAALSARTVDGREFDLHVSTRLESGGWIVEPREVSLLPGEEILLPGGGRLVLLSPYHGSGRLWLARPRLPSRPLAYLRTWGRPIRYSYVKGQWPLEMYQTVYARHPGSGEMPSAGRAFSPRVLEHLRHRHVAVVPITLHTGVASLETHEPPYDEWFHVPARTAHAIHVARRRGRRIVAVGTTVVRALESALAEDGTVRPARGWTGLVIAADRPVRSVDALLTGFHEPRASHLDLLSAIAPREHLVLAYRHALEQQYLLHEFGDLHLVL